MGGRTIAGKGWRGVEELTDWTATGAYLLNGFEGDEQAVTCCVSEVGVVRVRKKDNVVCHV